MPLLRNIYVDVTGIVIHDHRTGIQRVVRSILMEMLKNPPHGFNVCAVYTRPNELGFWKSEKFSRVDFLETEGLVDKVVDIVAEDIFLGLDLQHISIIQHKEYLLNLRKSGVRVWFVLYDLLPIQFPNCWPKALKINEIHAQWLEVITSFDGVACISETVSKELRAWLLENELGGRLSSLHIDWFELGADINNSMPTSGLPSNYQVVLNKFLSRPTFLMVGTLEPRKCNKQVLEAFELLWKDGQFINLVFVGKKGWMVDSFANKLRSHPEQGDRFFWLEGVSDEYLNEIYKASTCIILASLGEGFGLPIIEAAKQGLPVILRDIPIFREVVGKSGIYFSGDEPMDIAKSI